MGVKRETDRRQADEKKKIEREEKKRQRDDK